MNSIIGHSGFIGKNIIQQYDIENFYNSTNIAKIGEKEHEFVFICAPGAEKWRVNREPNKDFENISFLISQISKAKIKKALLFSTIDVYGDTFFENEEYEIDIKKVHPYGKNRYIFESYIAEKFDTTIIRLPGLFGNFLKKNIIYDLLNENQIEKISLSTKFQWLSTSRLKKIVDFCLKNNINLINYVSEPIETKLVVETFFPKYKNLCKGDSLKKYDVFTKYSKTGYMVDKQDTINDLGKFLGY